MSKISELAADNRAIKNIQKLHMKEQLRKKYIALEEIEIDFVWDEQDVIGVDNLWTLGYSIHFISTAFKRSVNDVFALLWDRLERGFINDRPGGIYGRS